MTRIGEHPEFATLAQVAADHLRVSSLLVEKDYWVTETLRELARVHSGHFVFKGGTSISKCFGIARRFSEDIDILVGGAYVTKGDRDRAMKAMELTVVRSLPLTLGHVVSKRGVYRNVHLMWPRASTARGGTLTGIAPEILLELGTRGGVEPSIECSVRSLLVQTLTELDADAAREALPDHDRSAFVVRALHPGRTLVEKLLLLLGHAERIMVGEQGALPARHGRHVFDVIDLLASPVVHDFLDDRTAFLAAVAHAEEVSREHWGDSARRPEGGFGASILVDGGVVVGDAFDAALRSDLPEMLIGDRPLPDAAALRRLLTDHAERL